MHEAVTWVRSLSKEGDEDALATGTFTFRAVDIRVDLLSHLVRDCIVVLRMYNAQISSSGLVALLNAAMHSGTITMLLLNYIADFDSSVPDWSPQIDRYRRNGRFRHFPKRHC